MTGLPVGRAIPTILIERAMHENFETIIDNVRIILERTPPELGADIYKRGIYLTGGSAGIGDLNDLISENTGLKVNVSPLREDSVAFGLSMIIRNDQYRNAAYSMEDFSSR